jgi:hypothetical protein
MASTSREPQEAQVSVSLKDETFWSPVNREKFM